MFKHILIILCVLSNIYLAYTGNIGKFLSTVIFIILTGIFIYVTWPEKHAGLCKSINNDDLKKFKEYLSKHNLKPSNIHSITISGGKTPMVYAMERMAFNIFQYLIDNNYNLKYSTFYSEPPLTIAALSCEFKYLKLLLKDKSRINLYAINKFYGANALEIAVWRKREDVVNELINMGMKFSIRNYNNTIIGRNFMSFEDVDVKIKKILCKNVVFSKLEKQFNMIYEISEKKSLNSLKDNKIYWDEYLNFA